MVSKRRLANIFNFRCADRLVESVRFVPPSVSEKYNLDAPEYEGVDQVVELPRIGQESKAEKVLKLAERQDM